MSKNYSVKTLNQKLCKPRILNKKSAATTAILLMLLMVLTIVTCLPNAKAASIQTHAFLTVVPNPIGVNQAARVMMWMSEMPPTTADWAIPIIPWTFKLTITKPDGITETRTVQADTIGGQEIEYTPDQIGTWYFQFEFQPVTVTEVDYLVSTSQKVALVVQQQALESWPPASLPTGYWERPIEAENREWNTISGNWLGLPSIGAPEGSSWYDRNGKFNPYTTAPKTAHILWTKPVALGGLVGGSYGANSYYSGNSYELKTNQAIIINGRLYYNLPLSNQPLGGSFACVDIRTGETLWTHSGTIAFGQLFQYDSLNQHGVIPYLWSTPSTGGNGNSMVVYDAFSGDKVFTIANATQGSPFFGPSSAFAFDAKGSVLEYILDPIAGKLTMWNSTRCLQRQVPPGGAGGFGFGDPNYWRPVIGGTYNYEVGIQWTVSLQGIPPTFSIQRMSDDIILCQARISASGNTAAYVVEAGYSPVDGHQLWLKTRTGDDSLNGQSAYFAYVIGEGIYANFDQNTLRWIGYDINDGNKVWVTEPYDSAWGSYFTTIGDGPAYCAYGRLYATAYDGTLHCYDMKTGAHLWDRFIGSSELETPYGSWPLWGAFVIADGKVYVGNGEHSPNSPMYRGEKLYCIDANTGDILWSALGSYNNPIIADGYLVSAINAYDNQIYCYGKGQTATTVQASPGVTLTDSDVLITGTITDQSPEAQGAACVSATNMEEWMEYLYMQKPKPTDVTGVPVKLTAILSDGSTIEIGTVFSDSKGFFATHWKTPSTVDVYKIQASFAGDDAYWSSEAQTAVSVTSGAGSTIFGTESGATDSLYLTIAAVIIVLLAIVFAVFILKKK